MRNILILILFFAVIIAGCGYKDVEINGTVFQDDDNDGYIDGGEPMINKVSVKSGKQQTETDINGKFLLEGEIVENGTTIKIYFTKQGHVDKDITVPIPSGDNDSTLKPEDPDISVGMRTN